MISISTILLTIIYIIVIIWLILEVVSNHKNKKKFKEIKADYRHKIDDMSSRYNMELKDVLDKTNIEMNKLQNKLDAVEYISNIESKSVCSTLNSIKKSYSVSDKQKIFLMSVLVSWILDYNNELVEISNTADIIKLSDLKKNRLKLSENIKIILCCYENDDYAYTFTDKEKLEALLSIILYKTNK